MVLFHSHFVEACRQVQHHYRRLVEQYKSRGGEKVRLRFARMELGALVEDAHVQALGVEAVPIVHVYRNGRPLVASVATGNKAYMFKSPVRQVLDTCHRRNDDVEWQE